MSLDWSLSALPEPALLVLPADAASLDEAHAAIELWEFYSGKTLDPTQRLAVELKMACRADGRWAAATTGREMSRQQGKGDEIEVPEFWGLIKLHEAILHTVHDAVLLSTQAQERMLSLFDHRDLRHLIDGGQVWKGTGQQMIRLSTGGQIWYRTRTGGGGRGVDQIDRLVIDEAQHATQEQLAAVSSTLMAAADPQLNAMGTAALEGMSLWWWSIRLRALAENPGAFGYIGHTAESLSLDAKGNVVSVLPEDLHDHELWRRCNPSVFNGRGQGIDFLEEEWWRLGPAAFAQEHLCVWAERPDAEGSGPISTERWSELVDAESMATDDTVSLGLSAPFGRETAVFAVDGRREDGLRHAAIRHWVAPVDIGDVVKLAKQLADGHGAQINIAPNDPALAWLDDLEAAGVTVNQVKSGDLVKAQQAIEQDVADGTLRHRGQIDMSNAVAGLAARVSGDSSPWSRRSSTSNVAPIMALAAARAGGPGEKPAEFFAY